MLKAKKLAELIEIAEQIGIKELKGLKKQDIIDKIVGSASEEKSNDIKLEPKVTKNNYRENRYNNGGNKNHQNNRKIDWDYGIRLSYFTPLGPIRIDFAKIGNAPNSDVFASLAFLYAF